MSELSRIQAVCITLNPKDPERAQRALSEIKKLGFGDVGFFDGVDGRKLSDEKLKSLLTPRAYFELKNGRYVHEALSGVGSVGCYLAHTNAWRKCLESGEPLAIFEDDFVAKPGTRELMNKALREARVLKFDVLRFQHRGNTDYREKTQDVEGSDVLMKVLHAEGLCAYIMTPRAARALLEQAFPLDAQVDHYVNMGCHYHKLNHLATKTNVFDDPQLRSHIDHNSIELYNDGFSTNTYRRHKVCIVTLACIVILCVLVFVFLRSA